MTTANHSESCGICHTTGFCSHKSLVDVQRAREDLERVAFVNAVLADLGRTTFQKKHGTAERWSVCDCGECQEGRAPFDQALAEERARREARPAWHDDSLPLAPKEPKS